MIASLESTTIKSSSGKAWFCLVVFTIILLMGLFVLGAPVTLRQVLSGWFGTAIGVLGVVVSIRLLVRPMILTLDEIGFELNGAFLRAPSKTPWCDVEEFQVHQLPRGGKIVAYNRALHVRKNGALAKFGRDHGGDHALPNVWPMSAAKLAETLNVYRSRALSKAAV